MKPGCKVTVILCLDPERIVPDFNRDQYVFIIDDLVLEKNACDIGGYVVLVAREKEGGTPDFTERFKAFIVSRKELFGGIGFRIR
jgi:hypothetical protein